ncbi:ADP-ribosylation factor-like protein 13B [Amphibalanus amphitrite]|uniref:ADP-ribosylation factor-like protein 13B n=1 Tax=Amphibalanus amphitrite TaxID=1232801 RepID=A0A6A4WKL1_AMPAM|nr:ADP-ribosylation factor-like protein 13B [Amphibalanus amphitrite]
MHSLQEPVSAPAPTLGFSRLEVRRRGWTVELYDVGGGRGIRGIWRNYLAESHGLAFVVDAADTGRTDECRDTLHALLGDPRVAGKPVLILVRSVVCPLLWLAGATLDFLYQLAVCSVWLVVSAARALLALTLEAARVTGWLAYYAVRTPLSAIVLCAAALLWLRKKTWTKKMKQKILFASHSP